jgi:hypothetical protein
MSGRPDCGLRKTLWGHKMIVGQGLTKATLAFKTIWGEMR